MKSGEREARRANAEKLVRHVIGSLPHITRMTSLQTHMVIVPFLLTCVPHSCCNLTSVNQYRPPCDPTAH